MSCLFRSLSAFVNRVGEDELRHKICDYLEGNPKLMEDLSLKDILHVDGMETADYVQSMRKSCTWGGAIEIKAFCEMYKVGVIVRIAQTKKDVVFRPSCMANASCLNAVMIEWQGAHYEPVFPSPPKDKPANN